MIKAIIQSNQIGTGKKGDPIRPQFADDFNVNWNDNGDGTFALIVDQSTLDLIAVNYTIISQEVILQDN